MFEKASADLKRDPGFRSMANQARKDPRIRRHLGEMKPGEIFANMARRRQNEKMRAAQAGKRAPQRQAQKDPRMAQM